MRNALCRMRIKAPLHPHPCLNEINQSTFSFNRTQTLYFFYNVNRFLRCINVTQTNNLQSLLYFRHIWSRTEPRNLLTLRKWLERCTTTIMSIRYRWELLFDENCQSVATEFIKQISIFEDDIMKNNRNNSKISEISEIIFQLFHLCAL